MATAAEGFPKPGLGRRRPDRLCSEIQASWDSLAAISTGQFEKSVSLGSGLAAAINLLEAREQYQADAQTLLLEPLSDFARLRPIRQSLEAMHDFDREANLTSVRERRRLDQSFQALLTEAALDLLEPWRIWRSAGNTEEWKACGDKRAARGQKAAKLLGEYTRWADKQNEARPSNAPVNPANNDRREIWWRQQQAVSSLFEIELALQELDVAWAQGVEKLVAMLRLERQATLDVIEKTAIWIEHGSPVGERSPVDELELATPDERLRTWRRSLERLAEERLPERVDIFRPGWPRPGWKTVPARQVFFSAFEACAERTVRQPVEQFWEQSATLVREAGRSHEIVNYWRVAAAGRADSASLLAEAQHNASTLLRDLLQARSQPEDLELRLTGAFRGWLEEGSAALEEAQEGWIGLLREPRGRRLLSKRVRASGQTARLVLHRAGRWSANAWERLVESLGGKLPAHPATEPVLRRATLRDTLALPASKGTLPAVYGSLFRLAPVEDRRFLIGRDQELAGLEQALLDWDAGRFAACLFVGARGSGKTSLLNCAVTSAFDGRSVIRTEFTGRALLKQDIDEFLRQILGLESGADLTAAFAAERRILMIEEAERTFLRKVGGFSGALHLLEWVQRTAATTLWIIVMNDRAFRVMQAAIQFGNTFSHRINAMSVSREDLENAILQRHRLSGLRLEFAPPPASDPRVSRLKRWIGWEDSPQKLFFDSLYQQSGGVFRSAFELWLSSIEQVQGETLKIRQPLEPAFSRFRRELNQEEHFTLLSIQEHGSLEETELMDLLYENEQTIRSRIARLIALGLVEADPDHAGYRVCPEAQRFANDLLRRVNLA